MWVSRYQNGNLTILDFNEARDNGVASCYRQITTPAPHRSTFMGRMLFLMPNRQCQSIEGKSKQVNFSVSKVSVHAFGYQLWLGHTSIPLPTNLESIHGQYTTHWSNKVFQQCAGLWLYAAHKNAPNINRFGESKNNNRSNSIMHSSSFKWFQPNHQQKAWLHLELVFASIDLYDHKLPSLRLLLNYKCSSSSSKLIGRGNTARCFNAFPLILSNNTISNTIWEMTMIHLASKNDIH